MSSGLDGVAGVLRFQQQVQLVLVPVAADGPEPREHGRRVTAEPGLGVRNALAGGQGEQPPGGGVAEAAAGGHIAA